MCDLCKDKKVVYDIDPDWGMTTVKPCPLCNDDK